MQWTRVSSIVFRSSALDYGFVLGSDQLRIDTVAYRFEYKRLVPSGARIRSSNIRQRITFVCRSASQQFSLTPASFLGNNCDTEDRHGTALSDTNHAPSALVVPRRRIDRALK